MSEEIKVILRKLNPDIDLPLIYSTWRDNLWNDQDNIPKLDEPTKESKLFYSNTTRAIRQILNDFDTKTMLAVLKDDPDFILGYSVITNRNLEWIYVKYDYRFKGIAKLLLGTHHSKPNFDTISHPQTKLGKALAKMKNLKLKENPLCQKQSQSMSPNKVEADQETPALSNSLD